MSTKYGIRSGQEVACLFYRDQQFLGAVLIRATAADQVAVQSHYYDDDELLVIVEIASTALGALKFEVDKPKLRQMVADRIAELNGFIEGEEESNPPPPPTDGSAELPF